MLAAETAEKPRDSLRGKNRRARAENRTGNLPRYLREPAKAFAAPQPPWGARDSKAEEHRERQLAAARALDGLPESGRAAVMAALHPGLGMALTRWWVDARHRPYTRGWDRRAFRASETAPAVGAGASRPAHQGPAPGPAGAAPAWRALSGG